MLAGGIGASALIALPDITRTGGRGDRPAASGHSAGRYVFVYGTLQAASSPGGSVAAAVTPTSRSRSLPAAIPVATSLATAPVLSPDQATVALVTVKDVPGGSKVTLTLIDTASATVAKRGSVTISGLPDGTNILATPVFAPGAAIIPLVLAITVPTGQHLVRKLNPHTGNAVTRSVTTWQSHHALAYFDSATGAFAGPFHLADQPSLALSTAVATARDLFVWTTREPQPDRTAKTHPKPPPLPQLNVYPLGSATPRLSVPALAPWPGGEPVAALPTGDVARLVNGRCLQVCSARTGDVTQLVVPPLNVIRAKPSAVTMQARPDGTLFLTKPGIGRAAVLDPADSFRVTASVSFPEPAAPFGAPWSKAVLSPSGDTLFVLGGAAAGGIAAYDVATGGLTASYSQGQQYAGLYQTPSGTLLAVAAKNPRLAFFSSTLSPLGTADTNLHVSAVF
ncbi:MAG TPA: hypothetical protein VHY58_13130 [Streptosporangiaceae bacterium]|jgi:hypothetical protein|nr:hypothetical protein [Streptosporangiaceae bacterium]